LVPHWEHLNALSELMMPRISQTKPQRAERDDRENEVQDMVDLRLGHHPLLLADVAPT